MPFPIIAPGRRFISLLPVLALLLLPPPHPLAAAEGPEPRAVVERLHETIMAVMKDGPSLGFAGRAARLSPVVREAFAFPVMTRIATGVQWAGIPVPQQQALIEAFSAYSVASYAANFARSEGERFETKGERPAGGGGVIVETKLILPQGDPVSLNYLMRDETGRWRIHDVFLSGSISELAGRRSEFASLLRLGGADGLLTGLEQKAAELARPRASAVSAPAGK